MSGCGQYTVGLQVASLPASATMQILHGTGFGATHVTQLTLDSEHFCGEI